MRMASMKIQFPVSEIITVKDVEAYILSNLAGIMAEEGIDLPIENEIEGTMYQSFDFEVSDVEIK